MKKIWPFTFSFLFFACVASVSPYMVLYYRGLGFTGAQIGLLTSISPLITLVCVPLWTGVADATRQHRLIMGLIILVGVSLMSLFPWLKAFAPVLLVSALFNFFFSPVSSFADSATMVMLADEKELYGRVRLGGTIGYGLTAPVAGAIIQSYGLKWAFWSCAILMTLAFIVSRKLVYGQVKTDDPARSNVRVLLANSRLLIFLVLAIASGMRGLLLARQAWQSP